MNKNIVILMALSLINFSITKAAELKVIGKDERNLRVSATVPSGQRFAVQTTTETRSNAVWVSFGDTRRADANPATVDVPLAGPTRFVRVKTDVGDNDGASIFNPQRVAVIKLTLSPANLNLLTNQLPGVGGITNDPIVITNDVPVDGIDTNGVPIDGSNTNGLPIDGSDTNGTAIGGIDLDAPPDFGLDFTYVTADFEFDGVKVRNVGLRFKGNSSFFGAVFSDTNRPALRYPYKVDFDQFVPDRKFKDLKKLNLHVVSSVRQPSGLSGTGQDGTETETAWWSGLEEYLSYRAIREFGIPTVRTGFAEVWLNGDLLGLYATVEEVDARFLKRNFDYTAGNLYKPEPPGGYLTWRGANITNYAYIGFQRGDDTNHTALLRLLDVLNHQPVERMADVFDVDSVLSYKAVNAALGNGDTYDSLGHNYYLYEGAPGRFYVFPWDMNGSQSSRADLWGSGGLFNSSPAGRPLTDKPLQDRANQRRYLEIMETFLNGAGSVESLNHHLDSVLAVVGRYLEPQAIVSLRGSITNRVTHLKQAIQAAK